MICILLIIFLNMLDQLYYILFLKINNNNNNNKRNIVLVRTHCIYPYKSNKFLYNFG